MWEFSVLYSQFFCESKTSEIKFILKVALEIRPLRYINSLPGGKKGLLLEISQVS